MSNDTHIILDKELRRDIDAIIQRLKVSSGELCPVDADGRKEPHPYNPRQSRERSLAVTKLQEAVMWLGMDLKAINDENKPEEEAIEREAKVIYEAKFSVDDAGVSHPWVEGGNSLKQDEARREARSKLSPAANPYPNSKDPTADGLKL